MRFISLKITIVIVLLSSTTAWSAEKNKGKEPQITPEFLKKHARPVREASFCTQYDIFLWPVAKDKATDAKRKAAPLQERISNLEAQMNNYSHKVGACTGDKVPSIQGGVWDKLHRGQLMMEVDEEGHSV